MTGLADPFAVAQFDAHELGRRFATRRRWIGLAFALTGGVLFVGGFAGFGVYGDRADALQKNGVHTTATVTDTALYGGRYGPNSFTEHIDVSFTTPSGMVQGVRIPIGEDDRFSVGQHVEISYDPANPNRAVFAQGYSDPGPIGFVFFAGIVLGAFMLIYGVKALRFSRRARRALEDGGRPMPVESRLVPGGRNRRTALLVYGTGDPSPLWVTLGSGWSHPRRGEATVFGETTRGSFVVVADPATGSVTAGRIWKHRRAPAFSD